MTEAEISDEAMTVIRYLARARGTDAETVIAEAIGLYEAYVDAWRSGARLLVEKGGRVEELVVPAPGSTR